MVSLFSDKPVRVHITMYDTLADYKVYITQNPNEAEEIIQITCFPGHNDKRVYLETFRNFADKIVYLKNPEDLSKVFCLRCGATKINPSWQYCADSFCCNSGGGNKTLLELVIKLLQNGPKTQFLLNDYP